MRKGIFALTLVGLLGAGALLATTDLPRVRAVYPTLTGGYVVCTGLACEGVLDDWQSRAGWIEYDASLPYTDSPPIPEPEFCSGLKASKPANCALSSPPSVPGFDPTWKPNGCGTGAHYEILLEQGLGVIFGEDFTGNFDAPYRTRAGRIVSFLGACNSHDRCWGEANDRTWCDIAFRDSMVQACAVEDDTTGWGSAQAWPVPITRESVRISPLRITDNRPLNMNVPPGYMT